MQTNAGSEATENATNEVPKVNTVPTSPDTDTNTAIPASDVNTAQTIGPKQDSTLLDAESPSEDFNHDNPPAQLITKEKYIEKRQADAEHMKELEGRNAPMPATGGNPNATVADPLGVQVQPRYDIVQNRSNLFLVIPDLKASEEDMGEKLSPGEVIKLTDFYSPQQINRSKGLRYASTVMPGVNGAFALVPLANEEQGANFKPPQKEEHAPGTTLIDNEPNDFDLRFEELEAKEAKREDRLKRKSLGMKKSSKHGSVTNV